MHKFRWSGEQTHGRIQGRLLQLAHTQEEEMKEGILWHSIQAMALHNSGNHTPNVQLQRTKALLFAIWYSTMSREHICTCVFTHRIKHCASHNVSKKSYLVYTTNTSLVGARQVTYSR